MLCIERFPCLPKEALLGANPYLNYTLCGPTDERLVMEEILEQLDNAIRDLADAVRFSPDQEWVETDHATREINQAILRLKDVSEELEQLCKAYRQDASSL
jgi:hypothetical protein